MTKEELKEEIIELLFKPINCKMFSDVWLEHKSDQILALTDQYYRESGWKSPEEVDNIKGLIKQLRDNSEEDYGAYGFHVQSKAAWTALMNVLKK